MTPSQTTRALLLVTLALSAPSWSGCSLISAIPGVPSATSNGTVAVTYDGKPVKADVDKVICTFDGKGNVGFLSKGETGDAFIGTYSTAGEHAVLIKTAEFPMSLTAANGDEGKDITSATVDNKVYTFGGTIGDIGSTASSSQVTKKPFTAVVTCK